MESRQLQLINGTRRAANYWRALYSGNEVNYELIFDGANHTLLMRELRNGAQVWGKAFRTEFPFSSPEHEIVVRRNSELCTLVWGGEEINFNISSGRVSQKNVEREPEKEQRKYLGKNSAAIEGRILQYQLEGTLGVAQEEGNVIVLEPDKYYARYELLRILSRSLPDNERKRLSFYLRRAQVVHAAERGESYVILDDQGPKQNFIPAFKGEHAKTFIPKAYHDKILVCGESEPVTYHSSRRKQSIRELEEKGMFAAYSVPPPEGLLTLPKGKYVDIHRATHWIDDVVNEPISDRASVYFYRFFKREEKQKIPQGERRFLIHNRVRICLTDELPRLLSPRVRHLVEIKAA